MDLLDYTDLLCVVVEAVSTSHENDRVKGNQASHAGVPARFGACILRHNVVEILQPAKHYHRSVAVTWHIIIIIIIIIMVWFHVQ